MRTNDASEVSEVVLSGLPLGLPVSSSGVAVGRRLSAETERRVAVIIEQAHARGGDGEPCLELLAGLAGAAWKTATAIGTAIAAVAATCVLVLCVIEVTRQIYFAWLIVEFLLQH